MSKKIKAKNKHGRDRARGASRASVTGRNIYSRKRSNLKQGEYGYRAGEGRNDKPNSYQARKRKHKKQDRDPEFGFLKSLFS
mgnify:CR=1 FL=1